MHTQKKMQDFLFFHPVKKTISLLGNNNFTAARIHNIQFFTRPQHNFHRTHLDFIIIFNLSEEERDREKVEREKRMREWILYISVTMYVIHPIIRLKGHTHFALQCTCNLFSSQFQTKLKCFSKH